ncbi:MAG: metal-dependent hydrolase [Thermomicrobiales bacterium]|nr:metal-dependent hydrolase [Thermomicrobiales bacterium]
MGVTIAAPLSPGIAFGAVWWGMVGGGFPDWLDLRSDYHRHLKHRGFSHSLLAAALATIGFWLVVRLVAQSFSWPELSDGEIQAWSAAFGFGYLSHILADACTHAGVRLWLPFSQRIWWLLPKVLRGKTSGSIDFFARVLALAVIVVGVVTYLPRM